MSGQPWRPPTEAHECAALGHPSYCGVMSVSIIYARGGPRFPNDMLKPWEGAQPMPLMRPSLALRHFTSLLFTFTFAIDLGKSYRIRYRR